jgi:hypothetical protein
LAYQRGVFWGVVPYTPAAPFSVKLLRDYEELETVADLVAAFRRGDVAGEVPFEVRAKLRPILALTEPSTELREITALRLANISRRVRQRQLTEEEEREVVGKEHRYLFPLRPAVVATLTQRREVYAVVIDSPITLHQSAITTQRIGEVTEEEFAEICERLVDALELDVTLIEERGPDTAGGETGESP